MIFFSNCEINLTKQRRYLLLWSFTFKGIPDPEEKSQEDIVVTASKPSKPLLT